MLSNIIQSNIRHKKKLNKSTTEYNRIFAPTNNNMRPKSATGYPTTTDTLPNRKPHPHPPKTDGGVWKSKTVVESIIPTTVPNNTADKIQSTAELTPSADNILSINMLNSTSKLDKGMNMLVVNKHSRPVVNEPHVNMANSTSRLDKGISMHVVNNKTAPVVNDPHINMTHSVSRFDKGINMHHVANSKSIPVVNEPHIDMTKSATGTDKGITMQHAVNNRSVPVVNEPQMNMTNSITNHESGVTTYGEKTDRKVNITRHKEETKEYMRLFTTDTCDKNEMDKIDTILDKIYTKS